MCGSLDGDSGYEPDVIVLNRHTIDDDPRWAKESVITQGQSAALAIEIVRTNWRDDYHKKFADYEALGIAEYWIVDYLGLGGRRYIGSPKQPTLSVYVLVDGEYEAEQFRGSIVLCLRHFQVWHLRLNKSFQQVCKLDSSKNIHS